MQLSPALEEVLPLDSSVLLIDLADGSTAADLRVALIGDRRGRLAPRATCSSWTMVEVGEDVERSLRPAGRRPAAAGRVRCCSPPSWSPRRRWRGWRPTTRSSAPTITTLGCRRLDRVATAGLRAAGDRRAAGRRSSPLSQPSRLSALGASGIAGTIDPDRGIRLDGATLALGCRVVHALARGWRRPARAPAGASHMSRPTRARVGPPVAGALGLLGWRAAFGGAARLGACTACGPRSPASGSASSRCTAALTVGASLDRQLDDPARYGLRWDARIVQFDDDTVARRGSCGPREG